MKKILIFTAFVSLALILTASQGRKARQIRRTITTIIVFLIFSGLSKAQIIINSDTFRRAEFDVTVTVLDSLSDEPMSFVSVYLRARGDTLITNFALSDPSGKAKLVNVNRGYYILVAEMLGYNTVEKEVYVSKMDEKFSVIRMTESENYIDAASISAVGNPIEIRKDTIIYNASSFKVGDNAMLEELLKKMPGVEVKDGSVTVNGEAISRITVGGRTFFFDDQAMALKNLPAKIVDKIKVIDKKNENAEFTGIVQEREKVLDVEVKKEFSKGWFGNVSGAGGTSIAAAENTDERLLAKRDFLYQANAMASYYNDTDQLTFIGNAYNVTSSSDYTLFGINNDGEEHPRGGLPIYTQAGVNYNTVKVKNLDLNSMANYKHSVADVKSSSHRTSFLGKGDELENDSFNSDLFGEHTGEVIFELKNKNREKFLFFVKEQLTFNAVQRTTGRENLSSDKTEELNSSSSNTYLKSDFWLTRTDFSLGWKKLGKDRRAITADGAFFFNNKNSGSKEFSKTWFGTGSEAQLKDLFYKGNNKDLGFRLNLSYVEPISESWSIAASAYSFASFKDTYKNAFDRTSGTSEFTPTVDDARNFTKANEYYSSVMDNDYFYVRERLEGQFDKNGLTIQFGASLQETSNRTYSKSLGVEQTTGNNEWLLDWSPFLQLRWRKEQQYLSAGYSGSSTQQSPSQMMPVLNIAVPTNLSMGNVYLLPSFSNKASVSYNMSNRESFSHLYVNGMLGSVSRGIVNATWFDSKGVSYRIPVNSRKPSLSSSIFLQWGMPLNEAKTWSMNLSPTFRYERAVSYQSPGRLTPLEADKFDYYAFMKEFWGSDGSGELFYSGKSGFKESLTNSFYTSLNVTMTYNGEHFGAYFTAHANNTVSRYTLDPSANQNLWNLGPFGEINYRTDKGFNFATSVWSTFYIGYPEGANKPFTDWSVEASKEIKAFSIGLKVYNILNQNNFQHTVSENFIQDSYSTSFGRFFLISLKYNFGKMNQAKNNNAIRTALRMN